MSREHRAAVLRLRHSHEFTVDGVAHTFSHSHEVQTANPLHRHEVQLLGGLMLGLLAPARLKEARQ